MWYRYRWLFVSIFTIIFFIPVYVFDIYPMLTTLDDLHKNKEELKLAVSNKNHVKPNTYIKTTDKVLQPFITSIQNSGLQIKSFRLLPSQNKYPVSLEIILRGEYQEILAMIDVIEENTETITIKNMNMKWSEGNIFQMNMNVLLDSGFNILPMNINKNYSPLFCTPDLMDEWFDQPEENLFSSPLNQIRLAGFFIHGLKHKALMMFPDHTIKEVLKGDVIGKEKAQVIGIFSDYVVLQLQNGKQVKMEMEND